MYISTHVIMYVSIYIYIYIYEVVKERSINELNKVKVHFAVLLSVKAQGVVNVQLNYFFSLGARRGLVVKAKPRLLYPLDKDSVPTVEEAGWASGPVWTGREPAASTSFQTSEHPVNSTLIFC